MLLEHYLALAAPRLLNNIDFSYSNPTELSFSHTCTRAHSHSDLLLYMLVRARPLVCVCLFRSPLCACIYLLLCFFFCFVAVYRFLQTVAADQEYVNATQHPVLIGKRTIS